MNKFYSLDDMISCVKREISMRQRVYARRVDIGTMTQAKANFETECMESVLNVLLEKAGRRESS